VTIFIPVSVKHIARNVPVCEKPQLASVTV
jgi:hypothetical protein